MIISLFCPYNIYYTDTSKVYCIKKDGSNVFTFSSPDLEGAYGIDTDRQGNVYVVGSHLYHYYHTH
jgi:hypothetical protein